MAALPGCGRPRPALVPNVAWGLPEEDQAKCSTLSDNLWTPFREIYKILRGGARTTFSVDSTR